MHRFALDYLKAWKSKANRKPLIIRGARQVGKSYLAHGFGTENFHNIAELNFERDMELASLFASKDPKKIIQLLELRLNTSIQAGKTLLFLDEIQSAPSVLSTLRYFHEEMPDLHVMAAGSLLEFALENFEHSMPVGRIEYLHLGPMQFEEYLLAANQRKLVQFLSEFQSGQEIPEAIHKQLMSHFRVFLVIGGMPEAIQAYLSTGSFQAAEEVKHAILATFKDDFGKYGQRVKHHRLQKIFTKLPSLVGAKFKYVHVDRDERAGDLARALDMLCMARVAYRVRHSSANGLPLGAEVKERVFKMLFLDVGLMSSSLGLNLLDFEQAQDVMLVNSGAICEQVVGQHLLYSQAFYREPELYYWAREKANASAELDYILSEGSTILPVEVKAGKSGTLKSLHFFLREKNRAFGIRLNSNIPLIMDTEAAFSDGMRIPYRLLSLPLYLLGQLRRLSKNV